MEQSYAPPFRTPITNHKRCCRKPTRSRNRRTAIADGCILKGPRDLHSTTLNNNPTCCLSIGLHSSEATSSRCVAEKRLPNDPRRVLRRSFYYINPHTRTVTSLVQPRRDVWTERKEMNGWAWQRTAKCY
jgi:hypothetical protein